MATDWYKPELWGVLWSNFKVWTSSPNNMVQTTGHLLLYLQKNVSSLGIIWKPLHLLLRQTLAVGFPVQNPFYEMQLHRDKPFCTTPPAKNIESPHLEDGHPAILHEYTPSKYTNHRYDTRQCIRAEHSGFMEHTSHKWKEIIFINENVFLDQVRKKKKR